MAALTNAQAQAERDARHKATLAILEQIATSAGPSGNQHGPTIVALAEAYAYLDSPNQPHG